MGFIRLSQPGASSGSSSSAASSGSSAGGGNNAYYAKPSGTNADASSAYTSATTITITGLSFDFTRNDIESIRQMPAVGNDTVYSDHADFSVTSGVITVLGATFAATDEFIVILTGPRHAYDQGQNLQLAQVLNQDYDHFTSVDHIIDEANVAIGTVRKQIFAESYRGGSFHLKCSGGVTFTIWATNDDTADESADTGWVDVSTAILGAASLVDSEGIYFVDTHQMPLKWMIKYVTSDATNAVDAWINKY